MTASCGGEGTAMRTTSSVRIPTSNHALLCSVGKNHENVRYHPFRMTPYLVKVPGQQGAESQLCCVLLAERVHSGYEGNGQARALRAPHCSLGSDTTSVRLMPARPVTQPWAQSPPRWRQKAQPPLSSGPWWGPYQATSSCS